MGGSSTATPATESVFESIAFEGQHLAIRLREDHDVSMINVIDPEGSLFAQQRVAVGETRVLIEMLDLNDGLGGHDHYRPGSYEVIALPETDGEQTQLDFTPQLRIRGVSQYTGPRPEDLGRVIVSIENVGTAPTWVYDLVYRNAPQESANRDLTGLLGIPWIKRPENASELVIGPGETQSYVGYESPLLFPDSAVDSCSEDGEFTVVVGVADGTAVEQKVKFNPGGQSRQVNSIGEYVCSKVELALLNEQSTIIQNRISHGGE
ncbi:hypothetical protein [Halobaculum limi]|uniref:hypothetical protein n=1 Tax=Halobaculum limi TaxID=3031916 RepID=UPI0024058B7C|nr:hypothetical protein [Halobaculum sp. YSMS11]